MRRQGQYNDANANAMLVEQMQQQQQQQQMAAQRQQYNAAMNRYSGQQEPMHPDDEGYQYGSSRQWDRDAQRGSMELPPYQFNEGQRGDPSRSSFQGQRVEAKQDLEKQTNSDQRGQAREQQMQPGYSDNSLPQSFEGLEQNFFEDIMKLAKEQQEAEDAENARHRERLSEISSQYQEKLLAIRARQSAHREEFLRAESQVRLQKYQQTNMNSYPNGADPGMSYGGYGSLGPDPGMGGEPHRPYGRGQYDSYRDRPHYPGPGGGRGRGGYDTRGPYPGGRAYNSGGRNF